MNIVDLTKQEIIDAEEEFGVEIYTTTRAGKKKFDEIDVVIDTDERQEVIVDLTDVLALPGFARTGRRSIDSEVSATLANASPVILIEKAKKIKNER